MDASIQSILHQTYTDFELIIINDGSTDGSNSIIQNYTDKRIKYINHTDNTGYVIRLNEGLKLAKGNYIARMDADDISNPNRFKDEIKVLEGNKNIGIVSSWAETFENTKGVFRYPTKDEYIKASMLFNNPICHPAVLLKKDLLVKNNLQYRSLAPAEDLDLWQRCITLTQMTNIPHPLLKYRVHSAQNTSSKKKELNDNLYTIRKELYEKLHIDLDKNMYLVFDFLNFSKKVKRSEDLQACLSFVRLIVEANNVFKVFDKKALLDIISLQLLVMVVKSFSVKIVFEFLLSPYAFKGVYSAALFYFGLL